MDTSWIKPGAACVVDGQLGRVLKTGWFKRLLGGVNVRTQSGDRTVWVLDLNRPTRGEKAIIDYMMPEEPHGHP